MSQALQKNKTLVIACDTQYRLDIEDMTPLQGDLKMMTEADAEKLERMLQTVGYRFPMFVWRSATRNYVIDGHQRLRILTKMREEGWRIDAVPIVYVEAETEAQARYLVLAAVSQYGRIDIDELANFAGNSDISVEMLLEDFRLPDIRQEDLEALIEQTDDINDQSEGGGEGLEQTISRPGDIWVLGEHRLAAGDEQLDKVDALVRFWEQITGGTATRQSHE